MKKKYTNLATLAFSALLCMALTLPATAQHRDGDNNSSSNSSGNGGNSNGGNSGRPAPQQNNNTGVVQQRGSNVAPQQRNNNNSGNTNPQQQQRSFNGTQRGSNYNGGQRGNNLNVAPQQRQGVAPGQRGYYNQNRVGVAPNRTYRTYPGLPYGHSRITVRPNGLYYNNRGYYRSYYAPRLGFSIGVLPVGYYPFYFGPNQYFFSAGLYYELNNNQYTVVEPPVGAAIGSLPDKAQSIVINGTQYYEYNGVYYQPVTKDDGTIVYQIAGKDGELNTDNGANAQQPQDAPQIGDMVDNLPDGCKTIKLNGQKYYVSSDGYYFQDATDVNGDKVFKIIGTPTDEPGN
jgi:hypothetical protein